jgi:nucleotidyltransferase/DNA polymerase involved in DNA repair
MVAIFDSPIVQAPLKMYRCSCIYMYMYRRIGHLDADCFYVSCERARHGCLRGQAVGVLSNQGACVIAKSYELKARGVTTGMPIWDALPLCPEAIFIKRDFEWYEVLSRRIREIAERFSPAVEYYSIDEMFFDAREMDFAAARELQQSILAETGVPVSVGVSCSKILAKLASSSGKPFGCTMAVVEEDTRRLLCGRPVEKITGIARRSAKKLLGYGIRTCEEFVRADRRLIRRLLTKRGEDLWWELNGTAVMPIQTTRAAHKNLSRGGSLGIATSDTDRLTGWVARNAERLVEALDYHQVDCSVLAMALEFKDGGASSWRLSLPYATADFSLLHEAGLKLLARCWRTGIVVSYMHLIAEELSVREFAQRGLFDATDPRRRAIAEVKRRINERVGRFTLRSGATLPLKDLYADQTCSYDICDIYGKTCF